MITRSIRHKGLRRLFETGDRSGLPAHVATKLLIMVSVLQDIGSAEAIERLPSWQPHRLSGDMKGYRSLTVTRNWRLTFRLNESETEILDLDFQDYH